MTSVGIPIWFAWLDILCVGAIVIVIAGTILGGSHWSTGFALLRCRYGRAHRQCRISGSPSAGRALPGWRSNASLGHSLAGVPNMELIPVTLNFGDWLTLLSATETYSSEFRRFLKGKPYEELDKLDKLTEEVGRQLRNRPGLRMEDL